MKFIFIKDGHSEEKIPPFRKIRSITGNFKRKIEKLPTKLLQVSNICIASNIALYRIISW